jgi:hypothetical protein
MKETANSIDLDSESDANGEVTRARIRFGPHYIVEVRKEQGETSSELCYTHHGFKAAASDVDAELERLIEEVRRAHPEARID